MIKNYLDINVYEAFLNRMEYIFQEFDNIYVSFSGGKDSGLLLNLILDYIRKNNIKKKIGLFHQDFEAQYSYTTQYISETFEKTWILSSRTGYVFLWRPEPLSAAMKCTGIRGTIIKGTYGSGKCLISLML